MHPNRNVALLYSRTMDRRWQFISVLVAAFLAYSCDSNSNQATDTSSLGNIANPEFMAELAENRDRWQDAGVDDYQYNVSFGYLVQFGGDLPLAVEVRGGETQSISYADGKAATEDDEGMEYLGTLLTIDDVFAQVERYATTYRMGDAVYDDQLGFLESAEIVFLEMATDGSATIRNHRL